MVQSQEVGPTITASLDDGPLRGMRIETRVVEGRPPSTVDVPSDDGSTCRYCLGPERSLRGLHVPLPRLDAPAAPRGGSDGSAQSAQASCPRRDPTRRGGASGDAHSRAARRDDVATPQPAAAARLDLPVDADRTSAITARAFPPDPATPANFSALPEADDGVMDADRAYRP
jgi:hypothetical protein